MTSQLSDDMAAATAWPEHLDPTGNQCLYSGMLHLDTGEDECPNGCVTSRQPEGPALLEILDCGRLRPHTAHDWLSGEPAQLTTAWCPGTTPTP